MNNRQLGALGENIAAQMLLDKGYKILERNFRCKYGEIDIIATDGEVVIFVEVKTRKSTRYGIPEEAVSRTKQIRLRQLAAFYLERQFSQWQGCRFDVYSISLNNNNEPNIVKVLENCF